MPKLLPEVGPNVIRSWLDDIATYGRGTDDWTLTKEHFEALCRYALSPRPDDAFREIGTLYRTRDGVMHATTAPNFGLEVHSSVPIYIYVTESSSTPQLHDDGH